MKRLLVIPLLILLGVLAWSWLQAEQNIPAISGKWVDGKPRISASPYTYDIAEGHVSGHTPWAKIGYNYVTSTNEEDMWAAGGVYTFPTSGTSMQIYSTSAFDASGSTGIRTVSLYYLDTHYREKTEILTMNGITAVTTVATDIYRVQYFRAASVGVGAKAVGDISIRHATGAGATIYGRIAQGYTRGRGCFWTVPKGKTLYVTSIAFSAGGTAKPVQFTTRATYDNQAGVTLTAGTFFMPFHEIICTDAAFTKELEVPTKLPETTDIKVSVKCNQANNYCTTSLRGWLEDN